MEVSLKRGVEDESEGLPAYHDANLRSETTIGAKRQRTSEPSTTAIVFLSSNSINKLPAEVRNKIYHLALVGHKDHEPIHIGPLPNDALQAKSITPWREPGLLQASKQTRHEAKKVYYYGNAFSIHFVCSFDAERKMTAWLNSVRLSIKPVVSVDLTSQPVNDFWTLLPIALLSFEDRVRKRKTAYQRHLISSAILVEIEQIGKDARIQKKTYGELIDHFITWVRLNEVYAEERALMTGEVGDQLMAATEALEASAPGSLEQMSRALKAGRLAMMLARAAMDIAEDRSGLAVEMLRRRVLAME